MNNVAFCPIDLPFVSVDESVVSDLIDAHNTGHHDGLWKALPLLGRVRSQAEFSNAAAFEMAWERRYDLDGEVLFNQEILVPLKPILDQIARLPMIATHAQILSQISDVGKHFDLKNDQGRPGTYVDDHPGLNDDNEPGSYKIMLNCLDEKSFYVSCGFGQPNVYVSYPPESNTFVINEKQFPHGATMPSKPKFIVSIFGLIDTAQHKHLLTQSIAKWSNHVIQF